MRVCLMGSPTAPDAVDREDIDDADYFARDLPLGSLVLAGMLEEARGIRSEIVDPNLLFYDYIRAHGASAGFHEYTADLLAKLDCDLYGFSTLCSSYPLTIRIAEALKRRRPSATVVFGGPQASVVDQPTLQEFPFVDFILRGEADHTFPELVERLGSGCPERTPALTFREGNQIRKNLDAPVPVDLDALPFPAYHLYPVRKPPEKISLELGRGCPFSCTFCSTNDFFRRRFRLKSPRRVLQEMDSIASRWPISFFDLVHDMFTVDRRRVVAFCETLLAAGSRHRWGCSARTDCVDPELIEMMAAAGCVAIFFGIETGSPRMQKIIDKGLDLEISKHRVAGTSRHGMQTTVSLIAGYPEETLDDLRQSLNFIGHSLRHPNCTPHFHLLAPLPGTPVERQHRRDLWLEEITTDAGFAGWEYDPEDRQLVARHREIFPNFYSIPAPHLDRAHLIEMREFFAGTMTRFRWILAAWYAERADLLSLFDQWRKASRNLIPSGARALRRYYHNAVFQHDFALFLNQDSAPGPFLRVMIAFERALLATEPNQCRPPVRFRLNSRISLANGVRFLRLDCNPLRAAELLETSQPPDESIDRAVNLIVRRRDHLTFEAKPISDEAARLLLLCESGATVSEIANRFDKEIGIYAIGELLKEGLITAY